MAFENSESYRFEMQDFLASTWVCSTEKEERRNRFQKHSAAGSACRKLMNTTVQNNASAKTTSPRRSRFPGKESGSVSFNLTALGRQLLKEQAAAASVSNGDYVEMLIRERAGQPPLKLPASAKQTGPKGGAKSFFFGKNRGTTTAVCVTPMAHRLLDEQVAASRMSRGDYVEYLLREKGGVVESTPHLTVAESEPTESTTYAAPAPQEVAPEVVHIQPALQPVTSDWSSSN